MPRRISPLDFAWRGYVSAKDALLVTQRAADSRDHRLLLSTTVFASGRRRATIALGRQTLDDLAVVALWAEFERFLFEHLRRKARCSKIRPPEFSKRVQTKLTREVEYWRIDDVLDLYKGAVDPNLIGQAKQVKDFRDWIAHKNPRKPSPPNIVPTAAYALLTEIVAQIKKPRP